MSEREMASGCGYQDALPVAVMVTMESMNVGLNTLYKAATVKGMSHYVFVVYAYSVAALVLFPISLLSNRSRGLPPMSFSVKWKIGLLGLIGASSQIVGYTGINYSSPTLASAISNLTPAFTFILAIIFRMEKLALRKVSSQAKVIGTLVSISGAFVVTLYKGPAIIKATSPSLTMQQHFRSSESNWVIGGICLTAEYILVPLWYIVQTRIMKEYPDEVTTILLYNTSVSMIAAVVTLISEGTSSAWKIGPSIAFASIICSGILGSGLNNTVHAWALRIKGPVFVAMFKPLSIVIAVAMGVMFLDDTLYLGSVVGAAIITMGFYTVMWGKAKEEMIEGYEVGSLESPRGNKVPLLQSEKFQDV